MPQYYFNVRTGDGTLLLDEGESHPSDADALACEEDSIAEFRSGLSGHWHEAAFELFDVEGVFVGRRAFAQSA